MKGLIWKVGNDKNINIWNDPWIHKPFYYNIQSPIQGIRGDVTIHTMMNSGSLTWNLKFIHQVFSIAEANGLKVQKNSKTHMATLFFYGSLGSSLEYILDQIEIQVVANAFKLL